MTASLPSNAVIQLNERYQTKTHDTSLVGHFDDLTKLAVYVGQTKMAVLCLIEPYDRQIISKVGLENIETYQYRDFWMYPIHQSEVTIVPDTLADKKFATHPAVISHPLIRFFVSIPLVTTEGLTVGTLSLMDNVPKNLNGEQIQALKTIARQIVERKLSSGKLRQSRAKLVNFKETPSEIPWDIVEIFESITDAFLAVDREWKFSYLNSRAEQILLKNKQDLIGNCLWDEFPEAIGSTFETECRRAISQQITVHFEAFYSMLGTWLEVRAYPYRGGLSVYFRDVTARKNSEAMLMERSHLSTFAAEIGIALGHGGALPEILNHCTQITIEHLDAVNACIWTVNQDTNQLELQALAFANECKSNICGVSTETKCEITCHNDLATSCDLIRPDSAIVDPILKNRQPYLTNDLNIRDSLGVKAWLQQIGQPESNQVKAFAVYPFIVEDRTIGVMAVVSRQALSPEAHSMLEWVANAMSVAIDRAWARSELLSRRESLLFRLASQIRNSLDLDTILETAVQEIRGLLQIDRCHFLWCWPDSERPNLTITHEACISQLPSWLADYPTDRVSSLVKKIQNLETIQIDDISNFTNLDKGEKLLLNSLGVTSQLLIPLKTRSGQLGAVVCSHCSGPRPWSNSEVELLQAVVDQLAIAIDQAELFAQTRATAFAAQTQAQQLQEALQNLKQTEAQLVQNEKMSSLGQMVAGIAHEINNPVNFIYGNLSYASDYIQDLLEILRLYQECYPNPSWEIQRQMQEIDLEFLSDDLPKLLNSMQAGTERIRKIVLSLRNFSRLDEAEMKPVNIHEGIDSSLLILQNRLKTDSPESEIEVVKDYGELPLVECYAGQLNQVFMNVLSNAIDALENQPAPRKISIRTQVIANQWESRGARGETAIHNSPDPQWVAISICDNGVGMNEEVRKHAFDPFFTTKPVGKGTGLGLSISYQIVAEKHGGKFKCISAPGEGAEFTIEIPICPHLKGME